LMSVLAYIGQFLFAHGKLLHGQKDFSFYSVIGITQGSQLIIVLAFSVFFFKEQPNLWTWVGFLLVVVSALILYADEKNKDKKKTMDEDSTKSTSGKGKVGSSHPEKD